MEIDKQEEHTMQLQNSLEQTPIFEPHERQDGVQEPGTNDLENLKVVEPEEDYQILDFESDSSSSSGKNEVKQIQQQQSTPLETEIEQVIKDALEAKMEAVRLDKDVIIEKAEEEEANQFLEATEGMQNDDNKEEQIEQVKETDEHVDDIALSIESPLIAPERPRMIDRLFNIGRDLIIPVGVFSLASYLTLLFSEGV